MSGLTAWPAALLMLVLAATAAWAQAYLLKPGDTLTITVFQDEKLNRVVVVAPDGRIAFPLAGHFKAGGRTAEAVEAELKFRLKKQYKDEIDITVAITGIKEVPLMPEPQEEKIYPSFYITGGVGKPGQYPFRTQTNVLQALAMAGGLSPLALKGRIKIRREVDGGETFYRFDYEAFLAGRDLSRNISLQDGDVIVVPERDKDAVVDPFFYVTGEVRGPASITSRPEPPCCRPSRWPAGSGHSPPTAGSSSGARWTARTRCSSSTTTRTPLVKTSPAIWA